MGRLWRWWHDPDDDDDDDDDDEDEDEDRAGDHKDVTVVPVAQVAQAIYDSAHWVGSIQERVFHGTNLKREREALESKFKEQRCLNVERLGVGFRSMGIFWLWWDM